MRRLLGGILVAVVVALVGAAGWASCGCGTTCGSLSGCTVAGDGQCSQRLVHRCDLGTCGAYDDAADDCMYGCEWITYRCHNLFGWYTCEKMTSYFETCLY